METPLHTGIRPRGCLLIVDVSNDGRVPGTQCAVT